MVEGAKISATISTDVFMCISAVAARSDDRDRSAGDATVPLELNALR